MPHRPRGHELETETRTVFEQRLPSAWVYRPVSPDYGLDGEVEVFAEGRATGQRFAVQLKGTDAADNRALAIRLNTATCEYYRFLDVPVLLVRYVAATQKLYTQWFHALDTGASTVDQQTITLRLTEADEWTEATPRRLVHGLEAFRWVHRPSPNLPIAFRVVSTAPEVHGAPVSEWARRIRLAMSRLPGLLTSPLETEPVPATPTIELAETTLRINLRDVLSITIPTGSLYQDPTRLSSLPEDAMIGISLVLEKAGHVDLASRIAMEFAGNSVVVKELPVAFALADALTRAHRISDSLEIAETLRARGGDFELAAWAFDLGVLRVSHAFSGQERAQYRRRLEERVRRSEEAGDAAAAAIAHYNLANHLRGKVLPREAFHHYRLAANLNPEYRDREYWCREVAGVLFEGRRYAASADFYQRARALESHWPLEGVLADALMFAGSYAEAQATFERALEDPEQAAPEWRLKAWALATLRALTGVDEQSRRPSEADTLASVTAADSAELRAERLNEALNADLLCGLAWFNRGVFSNQRGEAEDAFVSFLMTSLCQRGDVEAWTNAIALAIDQDEFMALIPDIAQTAYFANGDTMLEHMARFAEEQGPDFPQAEFLNTMERILRSAPEGADAPPVEVEQRPSHEQLDFAVTEPEADDVGDTDAHLEL